MPRFDVHLYPVSIVTVRGIEADSPLAAGCLACSKMRDALLYRFRRIQVEFDGEFTGFLVDVEGDHEFAQSRFFHNEDDPLMDLLRRFVCCHESNQPDSSRLSALLAEAREKIAQSA
jgi:hypothetical protein